MRFNVRITPEPPLTDQQPLPQIATDHNINLRRDDFAAHIAAYQKESHSPRRWALVGVGIGGIALMAILVTLGGTFDWPHYLAPYFFIGGWVIMLGSLATLLGQVQLLGRRYRLQCPECGDNLLKGIERTGGMARVEVILATSTCQNCGSKILAP